MGLKIEELRSRRAGLLNRLIEGAVGPHSGEASWEGVDARLSELNELLPQSLGYSEDREGIARRCLEDLSADEARKDAEAWILMGPPASGKSTLARKLAAKHGAAIIDPDDCKERIPEYCGGRLAGHVHEESGRISGEVLLKALKVRSSLVLPIVGRKIERVEGLRSRLKRFDYSVRLYYIVRQGPECLARARKRFEETGRFVPSEYILSSVRLCEEAFEQARHLEWTEVRRIQDEPL